MHPLRFISAEMHPYKRHYDRVGLYKHFVQTFLPLATGHWSLVTGHWPLAIGHWPLATGHWPLAILLRFISAEMHPLRLISAEMHPYRRHYDRVGLYKHFVQPFGES